MESLQKVVSKDLNDREDFANNYAIVDLVEKCKYSLGKDAFKFYEWCTKNLGKTSFAEMPIYPCPLLVDVDLTDSCDTISVLDPIPMLYNESTIREIILSYCTILNQNLEQRVDTYYVALFEKPARVENSVLKNGLHLTFLNVCLDKEDTNKVFKLVEEESEYGSDIDNVCGKPWLIYGSTKTRSGDYYKLTKTYKIQTNEDKDFDVQNVDFKELVCGHEIHGKIITMENVDDLMALIFSVRNSIKFTLQKFCTFKSMTPQKIFEVVNRVNIPEKSITNYYNLSVEKISKLVLSVSPERANDYEKWVQIGMILANCAKETPQHEDYLKTTFHLFSQQSSKYDANSVETKWKALLRSNVYSNKLTVGSLFYFAKQDGGINDYSDILISSDVESIKIHDYDIAEAVKEFTPVYYVSHVQLGCYVLEKTVLEEIPSWKDEFQLHIFRWFEALSKKMDISEEECDNMSINESNNCEDKTTKNLRKKFERLRTKIRNVAPLENIKKAMFGLYYDRYLPRINAQGSRYIAFNNCIFDLEIWQFIPPNPKLYLANKFDHDFIEWSCVPEENKDIVLNFWSQIFTDSRLRDYVLNNLARFVTGKNAFKQFHVWTGEGDNGKSVCINLMEYIFGSMCMKIPKTVVMSGVSKNIGGVCPEIYRLKDGRLAIIDELTKNDHLDPGQIKALTGNDKLFARDLFQGSKKIQDVIPNFHPILITNESPVIKHPDRATWNRIRLIPFKSVFVSDPKKYIERHPNADPTKVFRCNPLMNNILHDNAKYFLSHFMHLLFQHKSIGDFNNEEIIPSEALEGLQKFKESQNVINQFMDENFYVDETSSQIISFSKLSKEYNSTKPKITLCVSDIKNALNLYVRSRPGIKFLENGICGVSRVVN